MRTFLVAIVITLVVANALAYSVPDEIDMENDLEQLDSDAYQERDPEDQQENDPEDFKDVQRDEEMAENDVEDDDEENIPDDFVNYSSDTTDCKKTGLGTEYRGTVHVTKSGLQCQRWDSQSPQRHTLTPKNNPKAGLVNNYCRNPDSDSVGPWCYTMSKSKRYEACDVKICKTGPVTGRDECKRTKKGEKYRGTTHKTISGRTCQRWDAQYPHRHPANTPEKNPGAGLEENFCRNPDNEAAPWCYTMSAGKRWEICDIPMCPPDVNGGYSAWSAWGLCDKKCGPGYKHRSRKCDSPKQSGRGKDCSGLGAARQKMACNVKSCKKYPTVTAPNVSPSLKDKNIVFKCEFGIDAKDSDAVYEITWYQGNKLISTGQASSLNGDKRTATLSNSPKKLFNLGTTISCKVRSWFTSTSTVKHPYVESNGFFAGIQIIEGSKITITECGKPATITLKTTVPIAVNVIVGLRQNNQQIVLNACEIIFGAGPPGETKTFQATAKKDFVQDGNGITIINTDVSTTTNNVDWNNNVDPGIQITTVDRPTGQCTSWGDPHMKTFDGRSYNHFQIGDYTLVKSSCRKFEVQARTWRCASVSCNCGVAVKEGDDVIVVDMCRDRIPRARFASKKEPAPGATVKRDPSGKIFTINMPSGASVKAHAKHWFGNNYYMDLVVKVSCEEFRCVRGLCGTFDRNSGNDFTSKNGQVTGGGHGFTESWKLQPGTSLFNYHGGANTCNPAGSIATAHCNCQKSTTGSSSVCQKASVMNKPAFSTGNNGWKNCESPRQGQCEQQRKEEAKKKDTIILPGDDEDWKFKYHPKPLPNVKLTWPTKSGRTEADCRRICGDAIRNSAAGKLCSKVKEIKFETYIKMCITDLQITDDVRFTAASIDAVQDDCREELLENEKYWKKDNTGKLHPPTDFGDILCPNQCNKHGKCVKAKCICNSGYASADCSVDTRKAPYCESKAKFCDVRSRGDCQFVRLDGNNFMESDNLCCRAEKRKVKNNEIVAADVFQTLSAELLCFAEIKCSFKSNPVKTNGNPNKSKGVAFAGFNIAASNDKKLFSKGRISYIIYDSKCITCDAKTTLCSLKKDTCLINGYCFNAAEKNPDNAKQSCNPAQSTNSFTVKSTYAIGRGNLARGKRTLQSSTGYGGVSSRAVDGNRNSNYGSHSCSHTNYQAKPWWRVDLGRDYQVGLVKITNRGDCCGTRLSNFDIRVGNVDRNPDANSLCKNAPVTIPNGAHVTLKCNGLVHGRYVFVRLHGKNFLQLCEVEVYSSPTVTFGNNLARGKSTLQSSTAYGGLASRAVDGKSDPIYYRGHTCTCTNHQAKPWWRVDLGKVDTVASVKITNRGDCCGNRLRNFDILVGNTDRNPDANASCRFIPHAVGQGKTVLFTCRHQLRGRYVYVRLRNTDFLTLCEVEVFPTANAGLKK